MSLQEKNIEYFVEGQEEDIDVEDIQLSDNSSNIQIKIDELPRPILKKVEKKTVSYEDILGSLNMKVIDGKLQYIDKNAKPPVHPNYYNRQPIPLTREQYQKLVLENKKKREDALRRVQQIKSTKMMFSNNSMHGISVSSSNPTSLNRLFNLNR